MPNFASMEHVSNEFEDTFTAIFNEHWKKLYVIAYRRLQDEELAKDLVQDVFVYFWKNYHTIVVGTSVEAYLRGAVQFQIIAHFRKENVRTKAFSYLLERMKEVEVNIKDLLTEQDLKKMINSELEEMPETMRKIFRLRIQDYTVAEISENLGIAEKTVRNNITAGLSRFRKVIKNDFPTSFTAVFVALYIILTKS